MTSSIKLTASADAFVLIFLFLWEPTQVHGQDGSSNRWSSSWKWSSNSPQAPVAPVISPSGTGSSWSRTWSSGGPVQGETVKQRDPAPGTTWFRSWSSNNHVAPQPHTSGSPLPNNAADGTELMGSRNQVMQDQVETRRPFVSSNLGANKQGPATLTAEKEIRAFEKELVDSGLTATVERASLLANPGFGVLRERTLIVPLNSIPSNMSLDAFESIPLENILRMTNDKGDQATPNGQNIDLERKHQKPEKVSPVSTENGGQAANDVSTEHAQTNGQTRSSIVRVTEHNGGHSTNAIISEHKESKHHETQANKVISEPKDMKIGEALGGIPVTSFQEINLDDHLKEITSHKTSVRGNESDAMLANGKPTVFNDVNVNDIYKNDTNAISELSPVDPSKIELKTGIMLVNGEFLPKAHPDAPKSGDKTQLLGLLSGLRSRIRT